MKWQSPEWQAIVKERSTKDRLWKANSRGFIVRWQFLLLDAPGGVDKLVEWDIRNSEVVNCSVQDKLAPSEFRDMPVDTKRHLGRIVCNYWAGVKIHKQEVTAMMAIGMGDYDIQGDLTEFIKKIETFDAFADLTSTVPADYE